MPRFPALGTTTDAEGAFVLNVPEGSTTLVMSSTGLTTQEVNISSRSQVLITLQSDVKALSEVVVTGYSSQSRRDITGAVATVDMKELTKVAAPNVAQQLQDRVAGVTVPSNNSPGGEATVRIRRFGTINNNAPLYVIDGVPTKGGLNNINPNNIESMQVLKDASSASIYGSRAGNGVIIITTKKGKIGAPQFTFNSRAGIQVGDVDLGLIVKPQEFGNLLWAQRRNAGVLTNGNPSHPQYGNGPTPVVPDCILAGSSYGLADGGENAGAESPRANANNYRAFRFADLLLMRAEVATEESDLPTALRIVNQVRTRAMNEVVTDAAGKPAASYLVKTYPVFAGQEYARKAVRFERRLELAMEGHRFFDLVRWGVASDVLNAYLTKEKIKRTYLAGSSFVKGVNEYFPIPQAQIDIMGPGILKQNGPQ